MESGERELKESDVVAMRGIIELHGSGGRVDGQWMIGVVKGSLDEGYFSIDSILHVAMEFVRDRRNPEGTLNFAFEPLDLWFTSGRDGLRIKVWSADQYHTLEYAKLKKAAMLDSFLRSIGAPGRDIRRGWTIITESRKLFLTKRELDKFVKRSKKPVAGKWTHEPPDVLRPSEMPKERALLAMRRDSRLAEVPRDLPAIHGMRKPITGW